MTTPPPDGPGLVFLFGLMVYAMIGGAAYASRCRVTYRDDAFIAGLFAMIWPIWLAARAGGYLLGLAVRAWTLRRGRS